MSLRLMAVVAVGISSVVWAADQKAGRVGRGFRLQTAAGEQPAPGEPTSTVGHWRFPGEPGRPLEMGEEIAPLAGRIAARVYGGPPCYAVDGVTGLLLSAGDDRTIRAWTQEVT